MPDTEAIDRLFLELSQFTNATTGKELELQHRLNEIRSVLKNVPEFKGKDTILVILNRP